jgi:hypothetical protein
VFKWSGSIPSSTTTPQYTINLDLEKFNIGKIFNSSYVNILVMVTVVIGLVFLDVYLQPKKQHPSH